MTQKELEDIMLTQIRKWNFSSGIYMIESDFDIDGANRDEIHACLLNLIKLGRVKTKTQEGDDEVQAIWITGV